MGLYLGPTCKLSRREGYDLCLKSGVKPLEAKCKFDTPPGEHGPKRSRSRLSDYGKQLREKNKLRRIYGVSEKQFRNKYYKKAVRRTGPTGTNLLQLLEGRLDNVVYRMGFAATRREARSQLISHKLILVNGSVVNIPSYYVRAGDVISVREKAKKQLRISNAMDLAKQRAACQWVEVNEEKLEGIFKSVPERDELPSDIHEQLIVELYSK